MLNKYPVSFRFILFILLPLIFSFICIFIFLSKSLPQENGVLNVGGVTAPVKIFRDNNAVPHIFAKTDADAFFAIGYVHAQERIWQMEYQRRLGQGRLSEVLGAKTLNVDQMMRTLGLHTAARSAFNTLDEDTKQSLIAYAEGINTWIREDHTLPIEYLILDVEPELWQPEDSLLMVKLMALDLGQNFGQEMTFDLLVKELGLNKAMELMPEYPSKAITVTEGSEKINNAFQYSLLKLSASLRYPLGSQNGIGSNAWVVSGALTEGGKPILAADPHLANQIPSAWYLMEVKGNNLHVIGATFPGVPYVIFGHNSSIAWGATNLTADVQDIYVERVNPLNENQYEIDGQWEPMEIEESLIYIRPALPEFIADPIPAQKWQVRKTRHGPLISDALGKVDYPLALKWTALQEKDNSIESLRHINYAEDWSMFKSSLDNFVAPALNYVYADVSGNIAYIAAGKIPIRKNSDGKLPVPGWQSKFDWDSYIPTAAMPQSFNPESGIIISANNKVHAENYPYLISNSWSPPYRAERIAEIINQKINKKEKITIQDFIKMQGDHKSLQAERLLPFLLQLKPINNQQQEALEIVDKWDAVISENSAAAAIFQTWLRNFNEQLLKDDLKGSLLHVARGDLLQNFMQQLHPLFIDEVIKQNLGINKSSWCDNILTANKETCEELALIALDKAVDELRRNSRGKTQWGEIHKTYYPHSVFTHIQLANSIFDREVNGGGDAETINVASWKYSQDEMYRQTVGPSYRQVIDLGRWENSGFINNTGQSGNVLSEHYDDFIERHRKLTLLPMRFNGEWKHDESNLLILQPLL
jgi:penicillin amidase